MYSLIVSAKLNEIDPQAWLADVLVRNAEHLICRHGPGVPRGAAVNRAA